MFRTEATRQQMKEYVANHPDLGNPFFDWKERLVKEFDLWMIIENKFPYDLVAEVSHLLIPKRMFSHYEDMDQAEEEELFRIKQTIAHDYHSILENFHPNRSITDHFHFHLLKVRPGYYG